MRIKEDERDSLRFHWKPPGSDVVAIYRFTRALFGLTCSPFLLGGVLNEHLKSWEERYLELVKEIRDGLYVDDLMTGGVKVDEVKEKKTKSTEIFNDASFKLHKWHSNASELERREDTSDEPATNNSESETTYAKQQLGTAQPETRLLGLPWDKIQDTLSVVTNKEESATTKRGALSHLAKVYDPLGLVSPATLPGKLLYREMCETNLAWDGEFPNSLAARWKEWYEQLPDCYAVPRTLAPNHQPISSVSLHAFGDASKNGVAACVYAVVEQDNGTTQGLVCAKSRIAKRNLTIPRLELVSGHMATILVTNVEAAIGIEKVQSTHCWLDSTVALYWINGQGEYRQFVANQVKKIQEHKRIEWHHVPTNENPADLGSRGRTVVNNELWKHGPAWLSDKTKWPPEVIIEPSAEADEEIKSTRKSFMTSSQTTVNDCFDKLLESNSLRKTLRICACIQRFAQNSRPMTYDRKSGPLNTEEIRAIDHWWIQRVQNAVLTNQEYERTKRDLNLQPNDIGILECRGRIEGEYPIYLPRDCTYTRKVVEQAHLATLHGGVAMTMAKVRERYWIPKLRGLVKRVRSDCYGCVRFRAQAYEKPPPGRLPPTRTQGTTPFQVLGVDFAGPIRYQMKTKVEKKAYLVLYGCSLTRAVHLEMLRSLEVMDILPSLKRLIARRGRPKLIYSDNATTFKAAERWLKRVQKDESLHAFLANQTIEWRFNLSRAPWWGGQFERLIGLFKRAFYKSIGNGTLTWEELEDLILDIEVAFNNRPLSYVEDDFELSVLTPNAMLNINPSVIPELKPYHLEETGLRKRAKFLRKCKDTMWKRWSREYVRGLWEQHRRCAGNQTSHPRRRNRQET